MSISSILAAIDAVTVVIRLQHCTLYSRTSTSITAAVTDCSADLPTGQST